ncbi:MAG: alpha/beta hydrolase [Herbiconiux sp.]|uniref:alpha/beta hydrolase n=1 Tax=Herbiconiux sp. TaxID=1871186 RepID=UPI0011F91F96|nr:alpha/beta hydrolase [Herbiconiux sp.]TAJ49096.1 MAG: alpha/beta hydrolase [Herbiconiux sp.]
MVTESDRIVEMLRADPVDFAGELSLLRTRFSGLAGAQPLPAPARSREMMLGGVPVQEISSPDDEPGVVIFVHAGGFIAGSAEASRPLAARIAGACRRRVVSVDYSLAPEHPFPAARDELAAVFDALVMQGEDAGRIALVGASAGGGLALQFLADRASSPEAALPGALAVISPFADLALTGSSMTDKAADDPSLTPEGLARCAADYLGARPLRDADVLGASLIHFPPTLVQVGTREILLDDSLRLAGALAAADVDVRLECWAGMVHVFPTFAGVLREGREAIESLGAFVRSRIST